MGVPGYTEVRTLGSGGFGEVVLARHDASGTLVAIKYLRARLLADPEFAALFRAEAAVLASLADPNVVRLYEYVESPARGGDRDGAGRRGLAAGGLVPAGCDHAGGGAGGAAGLAARPGRGAPARGGAPGLQARERADRRGRGQQADRLRHRGADRGGGHGGRDAGLRAARAVRRRDGQPGRRRIRGHGHLL